MVRTLLAAAAADGRAPPALLGRAGGWMAPRILAAPLSPLWKANERRPFLATSTFRNEAGAAVAGLRTFTAAFLAGFFFAELGLLDFVTFLPDLPEVFVAMIGCSFIVRGS